jgi:uncharacterized LabA/DUF88 family protein
MRVNVYVDGFNLYYGIKKYDSQGKNYRWLDLNRLAQLLLPSHQICRIRYFTAKVDGRHDSQSPKRQQIYWRAIRTLPNLTIHQGRFLSSAVRMPLASPSASGPRTVEVWKTEEKGSDVNIATYLMLDCFHKEFDIAAIISNDSDLIEPIRVVRKELGCVVYVFNHHGDGFSNAMKRTATRYVRIEERHLSNALLPTTIQIGQSQISCPTKWL